jgi:long-chain acyl-CoA synthetase
VTTLSWPSEAVPESVLTALTGPGAPFELREEAVLDAPMLVFAQRPRTLVELLRGAAERMGDRPYVIFPDRQYTFASILQPIAAVAAALRDEYGVGPGDRVAIVAPNTVEYALTFWATTALGAITVGLNGWWTGEEIAYAVELTEPKVLFGDRRRLERLADVDLPDGLPVLEFERDFPALEAHAPDAELPDVAIDEDDPFVILFTSGTTGRPKGVMLSHRSNIHFMMASMLNGAIAMMTDLESGVPITSPAENP